MPPVPAPVGDGPDGDGIVRAAGGVPVRPGPAGPEVLLVHRSRYDDWSFPKGKLDPGESWEAAAVREVWEETGLVCLLGAPLPGVGYVDHRGRPKQVRWWAMTPVADTGFEPDDEVDERRWVPVGEAGALLTYPRDALVLDALTSA